MSGFEWDSLKSDNNKVKHGISFREGLEIWQGVHLVVEGIAYGKRGENRGATIGYVVSEVYTAIWTRRNNKIRIISIRRARDGEKEVFFKNLIQKLW
ncbi:MAG: BrnT family toxin [Deltaproteobacteria bacterium]|nr:BrnT family toxin [Deltaproteobacteria bacterium]